MFAVIVSHKYKYIFIRPQKVGGTSVAINLVKQAGPNDSFNPLAPTDAQKDEGSFQGIEGQNIEDLKIKTHMSAKDIREYVGQEVWDNYTKISIIRNPWDLQVSGYWWVTRNDQKRVSFDEYITKHYMDNSVFYFDKFGRKICDVYLRIENLNDDYKALCDKLGIDYEPLIKAKAKIRKKKQHYSAYYSPFIKSLVGWRDRHTIRHFDYFFEDKGMRSADNVSLLQKGKVIALEPARELRRLGRKI